MLSGGGRLRYDSETLLLIVGMAGGGACKKWKFFCSGYVIVHP
jgi:hypothetical protein